jgi:hypothetical protein
MLKKMSLVLSLLLSTTALPASAVVININYSATITQVYGDYIGYSLGDKVEGLIKLDLSKSAGDQLSSADYLSQYIPLAGESNMVSGYSPANIGSGWDRIDLYNGIYNDNIMFVGDSLEIIDGSNEYFSDGISNIFRSLQLYLAFNNPDIVTNDNINNILDFSMGDLLPWKSSGAFVDSTFISLSPSDYTFSYGTASFEFTSLSAKISNVDEPASMGLFALMLISLVSCRKFIKK